MRPAVLVAAAVHLEELFKAVQVGQVPQAVRAAGADYFYLDQIPELDTLGRSTLLELLGIVRNGVAHLAALVAALSVRAEVVGLLVAVGAVEMPAPRRATAGQVE